MDRIRIRGGSRLKGEIPISGAKNAALPLMAACLLTDETLRLGNLPHVADITTMANLLAQLGVEVHLNGHASNGGHDGRVLELTARQITETRAPYDLVRKMRASVLVLGPLVARYGRAEVSLPGGCSIGTRPIDLHLQGLRQLGAEIELTEGYVIARAPQGLTGARIVFPKVSVGATENLMLAATLARGETELVNVAREPEINDLALCLQHMGADIQGLGTDRLRIRGVERLKGTSHQTVGDRIEAGTYAMAAAITDGEIELVGARLALLGAVAETLRSAGVAITETNRGLKVAARQWRAAGRRCHDRALSRLRHRSAGADDGDHGDRPRGRHDHRDDLRESLHACAGALPHGRQHQCPRRLRHGARRAPADRGAGHGDRPPGLGLPGPGGARGRRRYDPQSRLSSRPRL